MMRDAYSLIEAMIAVSILSIVIAVGTNIIFISADTENINKSMLVADGLATEGIEAVQGFYDTNVLKYGRDSIDICRYTKPSLPGESIDSDCDELPNHLLYGAGTNAIYYSLNRNYNPDFASEMLNWKLGAFKNESIVDGTSFVNGDEYPDPEDYRLFLHEIKGGDPEETIAKIYVPGSNALETDLASKYYREVSFELNTINNEVIATSTVYWKDQNNRVKKIRKQLITSK